MQDWMIEKPRLSVGPTGLAGDVEPTARLEPLGVPLSRMGGILRRHYWILLVTVLVGVGGTAAVVKSMPKQYTAQASILIEPRHTQVSDLQAISPDPGDVNSLIRTQIDILSSATLRNGVVQALHLDTNPQFAEPRESLMSRLTGLAERLSGSEVQQPVPTPQQRLELATLWLGDKVSFANELRSSVLRVMVTTQQAALSADIANELVRQYLEFRRQEKFAAMQRAHDWLREQLENLSQEVQAADQAVENYQVAHGLMDLPSDGTSSATHGISVTRQELSEVASALTAAARDRAQKEADLAQAQAAMNGQQIGSLPNVLVSPVITQLLAQEATIAGREAQLAASQGTNNPELVAVRAELRKLQLRVSEKMSDVVHSLAMAAQAARAQEQTLQQRMNVLRREVGVENSAEVGLESLKAKARVKRGIYDSFLTRETELANVAGIQEPDSSLVSSATPPLGPSAPHPLRFVTVAGVLSLVIGVGLACTTERIRRGFGSSEQLEAALGISALALLPKLSGKARRQLPNGRRTTKYETALDKMRGHLRTLGEERPKVIMLTSALPQEGKSMLASRLAANAAAAGWRVLLLDCDFRRPSLAQQFKLPPGPGLADVLVGAVLGDHRSAFREARPRLHLLTAGTAEGDPQELLASDRMAHLLLAARAHYDVIVLDTPPVLAVADALMLARQADATLLVVRWEKTPRTVVHDALRLLRNSRARVLGAALTCVDLRRAAQSSGRPAKLYEYDSTYYAKRA